MLFSSNGNTILWFQPSCVCTQQTPPLMPEEPTQAVRQARLWGAKMKGVGATICQPSMCPPVPSRSVLNTEHPPHHHHPSPSVHLNPHDNRSRPDYSSRLAGGYLLVWQPTCHKSRKLERRVGDVWESGWGNLQVRGADLQWKLWCGLGVSVVVWLRPNQSTPCHTSQSQSNSEDGGPGGPNSELSLLRRLSEIMERHYIFLCGIWKTHKINFFQFWSVSYTWIWLSANNNTLLFFKTKISPN